MLPGGLHICRDLNCPGASTGRCDEHLEQIIDDYELLQHITVSTRNHDNLLEMVITAPRNTEVLATHIDGLRISDHYLVKTSLVAAKRRPHPSRSPTYA